MDNDNTTLTNLIKENKGLICSIISKYASYYDFDDLYQVSTIGIIKAFKNYNEKLNVKFTTYAYKYILSEIIAFINNSQTIRVSKEYHKLCRKIIEARNILTQKLMKEPTNQEISNFLEIDERIINDVMKYQDKIKSLEEITNSDGRELNLLDRIYKEDNNIDDNHILLKEELKNLNKNEYELIKMRYFEEKTQSEIATLFGTNQVQISRNEQKILKKLKKNLAQT